MVIHQLLVATSELYAVWPRQFISFCMIQHFHVIIIFIIDFIILGPFFQGILFPMGQDSLTEVILNHISITQSWQRVESDHFFK